MPRRVVKRIYKHDDNQIRLIWAVWDLSTRNVEPWTAQPIMKLKLLPNMLLFKITRQYFWPGGFITWFYRLILKMMPQLGQCKLNCSS